MRITERKKDRLILLGLLLLLVGLPGAVFGFENARLKDAASGGAKVFTLTGHAKAGWIVGEVRGYDVATLWSREGAMNRPVLEVKKGETVILRLKSSDVIHGFSLKDFGVLIDHGIKPGKVKTIKFKADKVGRFQFSCNNICGDAHENMIGFLVVKA